LHLAISCFVWAASDGISRRMLNPFIVAHFVGQCPFAFVH